MTGLAQHPTGGPACARAAPDSVPAPDAVAAARASPRLESGRPLRVLTFSSLFPNSAQPTQGLFVWRRLSKLVATGEVEATVVAPVPWFPSRNRSFGTYAEFARIPRHESWDGLEVHHPRHAVLPKVGMNVAPALMALGVRRCVARLHRERRFDLIDAHYFYPDGVAAAWIARSLGLPLAITARGTDLNLIARYAVPRTMIRWAANRSRLNVTVSAALAERLRDIGAAPAATRVIPNGVDLDQFRPLDRAASRRSLGLADSPWLLSVGSLVSTKGHDHAIGALALLPGWGLLIAGHGPEERKLRVQAEALGVADRVVFCGRVGTDRMPAVYSAGEVLVLASAREGMPNVLLESLSCGTPVIASGVGGCPEIVRDPIAGRLLDATTPASIAAAVRELVAEPPNRAAVAAYATRFAWEPSVRAQLDEFRRIARGAEA
jgi:teichuronic acid biosynthesis glycosyltransferase TuaC